MVFLREGLCPGLTEEVIQALRTQEIRTVEDLVSSELEELAQKCSISYKALVAIRRVLLTQHTGFPVSGADLYEELLSSMAILSTGNESLDVLLDAGLYTGEVTELAGGPGSGKTQVCLGVAVNISCVLKRTVLYIDTNGGLSASRLLQMVQSKTSNMEEQVEALNRILVCRVFDVFSLLETLHSLRSGGLEQASVRNGPIRAVLVDSVTAVLSHMLGGRQTEGDQSRDERWKRGAESWAGAVVEPCAPHPGAPAACGRAPGAAQRTALGDPAQVLTTALPSETAV
ncbi:DNA repair protein RAD51 homolog 4 isoform X2 [Lepisosteus oculatus]|uniref:DNA repair protein RAD51 homolog 4 isoform X2 n=1 Tax=Lepisosteus oculatus TaxID=7918 RepID=UPI00073FC7BF|nr:PREDICTED: DNA repair protein RAD51 homolog 4 isoform X2 [Lepisosteus oculatus]